MSYTIAMKYIEEDNIEELKKMNYKFTIKY